MGFSDEYNLCRPHVNQLNFHWIHGKDWYEGYVFDPSSIRGAESSEPIEIPRDKQVRMGIFETGIRYFGGLLGAYDLSGDKLLLERAVELATILGKAFNTASGLPSDRMNPGSTSDIKLATVSSAEVGSMALELIRLSQVTGDRQWFDLAQRAMEYIAERVAPRSTFEPMLPLSFQPDAALDNSLSGTFAWGGLIDSYYEYLIKTYLLLRGSPVSKIYQDLYQRSVNKSREVIFRRTKVVPGMEMLIIGKYDYQHVIPEVEHLTCFAGAMLGLGAQLLDEPNDMVDAQDVTKTCYWLSAATGSGMQPESAEFYDIGQQDVMWANVSIPALNLDEEKAPEAGGEKTLPHIGYYHNDHSKHHHPHADSIDVEQERAAGRAIRNMNDKWHWTDDGAPVYPDDGGREAKKPEKYYRKLKGNPAGTRKISPRALNRPETIESIFYM